MLVPVGYPDFVDNKTSLDKFYENLQISKFDNYVNARAIRAFRQAYQFAQLKKPQRTLYHFLLFKNYVIIFFLVGAFQLLVLMLITLKKITRFVILLIWFAINYCNCNICSGTNFVVKSSTFWWKQTNFRL